MAGIGAGVGAGVEEADGREIEKALDSQLGLTWNKQSIRKSTVVHSSVKNVDIPTFVYI